MDRKRASELFEQAIDLPAAERAGFVKLQCGDDTALREEVLSLLSAFERAGSFLGNPTSNHDSGAESPHMRAVRPSADAKLLGTSIGPFKILELLGEGGFGSVYLADQQSPIRRRVALKILKPGMDSKQVIARFEAERQALAIMDHPNIAKVFDAGTTADGRPYFVMELVRGAPITTYCDGAKLSPRERLELLIPVCQAIQHAHTKGIIHRDLKPGNVLVTMHDGEPVPKVIDFGIAKALSGRIADQTVYTEFRQMIGTPAYMSPEQAEMTGQDIDIRSDIYSLGVLMYELLSGSTPFDTTALAKAGIAEIQRIIREEDPPKPSTRVSTAGDRLITIAGARRTEPRKLGNIIRGELDWIVMRALEKDRRRRYQTADAFAADLRRFLSGDAVQARPASSAYRFRKFVARNKVLASASGAIGLAVLLGLIVSSAGFYRAAQQRDRALAAEAEQSRLRETAEASKKTAEKAADDARAAQKIEAAARESAAKEAARAEAMLAFSDLMLGSANPDISDTGNMTTRQMLDRAAARAGDFFKDQPEAEFAVRVRIGRAYFAQRNRDAALAQFRRADDLASQLPPLSADTRMHFYWPYAGANAMLGEELRVRPGKLLAQAQQDLIEPKYPEVWRALTSMKESGVVWSQLDEARGHRAAEEIERAIREQIGLHAPESAAAVNRLFDWGADTAWRRYLGSDPDAYSRLALDCYDRALGMMLEFLPETHSDVALIRQRRVEALRDLKEFGKAIDAAREWRAAASKVLPEDHWILQVATALEGVCEMWRGNYQEAVVLLEGATPVVAQAPGLAQLANDFAERTAQAYRGLGKSDDAARWEIKAAEWCKSVGSTPRTREVLARGLSPAQKPLLEAMIQVEDLLAAGSTEAGPAILRFIELRKELCKADDPAAYLVWRWEQDLTSTYDSGMQSPGVTRLIRFRLSEDVLELVRHLPRIPKVHAGFCAYRVGLALCDDVDPSIPTSEALKQGEALLREAIDVQERHDADHPYSQLERSWLGRCLYRQGRYQEALDEMGDCLTPIVEYSGAGSYYACVALHRRVQCLLALKRDAEARELISSYLMKDGANSMSTFYATYFSRILLQGKGASESQINQALTTARQAVLKDPKSLIAQSQLLGALFRLGKHDEANTLATQLVRDEASKSATPSDINVFGWTIVCRPEVPETLAKEVADLLATASTEAPKNSALANTLAIALYRARKFPDAEQAARTRLLSRMSDGFSTEPTAGDHAILVLALHALGKDTEARAVLDAIPSIFPDNSLDPDDLLLVNEARQSISKPLPTPK